MVLHNLRDLCRSGRFCDSVREDFATSSANRSISANHFYIIITHCLWCEPEPPAAVARRELSRCYIHYASELNASQDSVPQLPPLNISAAPLQSDSAASVRATSEQVAMFAAVVLYVLLICFGLSNNLFVAIGLLRRRAFKSITNFFVLTLSLSDILICGMLMPALVVYDLSQRGYLQVQLSDKLYCKLLLASLNIPIYVSCLIILWIAVDRYRLVCHPHSTRMSKRVALTLIFVTVAASLLIHSPVIAFNSSQPSSGVATGGCSEKWPNPTLRLLFSITAFCTQFCTPLIVSCCLYFSIYRRLKRRSMGSRDQERKRRTNRILISIVICFACFWSPWSVFNVVSELEQYRHQIKVTEFAQFVDCIEVRSSWRTINDNLHTAFNAGNETIVRRSWDLLELFVRLFALGSACVNPYLYGWLNSSVRDSLLSCLPDCCKRRSCFLADVEVDGATMGRCNTTTNCSRRQHQQELANDDAAVYVMAAATTV